MHWRLTDTWLDSTEAAAILAVLCQHCVKYGIARLPPYQARDLAITENGDLILHRPALTDLDAAVDVVLRLADELIGFLDTPADALSIIRRSGTAGAAAPVTDLAQLGAWLQQSFSLTDSRAVLRPVADRMNVYADWTLLDVQGDGARATPVRPPPENTWPAVQEGRITDRTNAYADWTPFQAPEGAASAMAARRGGKPTRGPLRMGRIAAGVAGLALGLVTLALVERGNRSSSERPARPYLPRPLATRDLWPGRTSGAMESPRPLRPARPIAPPHTALRTDAPPLEDPDAVAEGDRHPEHQSVPLETPGIHLPVFSPSFDSRGGAMFFHVGRAPQAQLVEARLGPADELVQITALTSDGSQNYHARLSPDGTQVAFDSDRDGERAVYIAQRDGSRLRRVSGAGFAAIPTWSPDGSMLAFVRGEAARPHVWNLWVLEVASNRLERFTSHRYGQLWGASWFPDGRRVCYSHEGSLYVLDLTNGDRQQFDSPIAGRMVRTPAVSPDGGRIVFQVQRNGVWLLELADRSMRRILTDASAEEFTWDPPGRRVAYHSRRDGRWRIWITATPPPAASETQESPPS